MANVAIFVDLLNPHLLQRMESRRTLLSPQLSMPAVKALCFSLNSTALPILLVRIPWNSLTRAEDIMVGLKLAGSTVSGFLGMKMVLASSRWFGSF